MLLRYESPSINLLTILVFRGMCKEVFWVLVSNVYTGICGLNEMRLFARSRRAVDNGPR